MSLPDPVRSLDAAYEKKALRCLQLSARLLLEYNARSEQLVRQIARLARHLGIEALIIASYRVVTIVVTDGRAVHAQAPTIRIDLAVSISTQRTIDDLCADRIGLDEAIRRLETIEQTAPHYGRWTLVAILGLSASMLALLLRADLGAIVVSGMSTSLGLVARQELAKRNVVLFAPPFVAALIGGGLGGLAISLGWTQSPGLCLIVPALMLVPGPHLITGMADIMEDQIQMGICRLGLAAGVLVASTLGVVIGAWLTLRAAPVASSHTESVRWYCLLLDVALAGLSSCGFAAFFSAPSRVLWVATLCGLAGYAIRWVTMTLGASVGIATLIACVFIGLIANMAGERLRVQFSAVAFAGAVPLIPGIQLYQSMVGALRLSAAGDMADAALVGATVGLFLRAAFVVIAMVIGLLLGARLSIAAWAIRTRPS
jgi:uncharacterized membrane protein YjjP (DUF1212 family)